MATTAWWIVSGFAAKHGLIFLTFEYFTVFLAEAIQLFDLLPFALGISADYPVQENGHD